MFFLWHGKRKVGKVLNSATVLKDAACSLACIKLSVILFLGSLVFLTAPALWWVDALAKILLSYFIGKEGLKRSLPLEETIFRVGVARANEWCLTGDTIMISPVRVTEN